MARPLRVEFPDAGYHVMNRGANRKCIFQQQQHYRLFLDLLADIHEKYLIQIHAYCLMTNHYHLLLKTPLPNLQRAMRDLNGIYTQKFNRSQRSDGALFRGRYKAILVEKNDYLFRLSRYIHLNPVAAKMCLGPENYRWSSYQYYVGNKKKPDWLYCNEILKQIGGQDPKKSYRLFTNGEPDKEINTAYENPKSMVVLGSDAFKEFILKKHLSRHTVQHEFPEYKMVMKESILSVKQVMEIVANFYSVGLEELTTLCPGKPNKPRLFAMYLIVHICQVSMSEIANYFKCRSYKAISNAYAKVKKDLLMDSHVKKEMEDLLVYIGIGKKCTES